MASRTYYFSGISKWAKVQEPVDAFDKSKPREYTVDLYMDAPSLELFNSSGSNLKVRRDADGTEYVRFKCPEYFMVKGEKVESKPLVLDRDNHPFNGLVGNGSEVTCKVVIYDTAMGNKGHRLQSMRVENLVEYSSNGENIVNEIESPF